jgi:16S rRNA processing protein RimM
VTQTSSAAGVGDPVWPEDAVEVGRILDAWGIKGAFKVKPFASDPQALFSSRRWFLKPPESEAHKRPATVASAAAAAIPQVLKVSSAKEHGDVLVVQSHEVPDRTAAEALRGARVFVSRTSFPTPDPDEYYWVDLIGLSVVNLDGDMLGTVAGLLDTGPHSVLRVAPDTGGKPPVEADERLIPFVAAYVRDVSLAERRITVDWGLDY